MNRATSRMRAPSALIATLLVLAGCSGTGGGYPSLAIRDIERVSGTAQPVQPETQVPVAPPVSEALDQRIARLTQQARTAHATFQSRAGSAARTVAVGRGSRAPADRWVASQIAVAELQALRSVAMIALADLDTLFTQERLAFSGEPSPAAQALDRARQQIGAWVEEEDQVIARLAGQIAS